LRTRVGTLNLLVLQDRSGTFSTRLISRYQSNERTLVWALMVSTRRLKEVTEELCGTSFSKRFVSSLAGSLDSELQAWRSRRLEADAYPYLFVDARYEKVRVDHRVVRQGVLVVSGVREEDSQGDGRRLVVTCWWQTGVKRAEKRFSALSSCSHLFLQNCRFSAPRLVLRGATGDPERKGQCQAPGEPQFQELFSGWPR
jgi:hypothetical protein